MTTKRIFTATESRRMTRKPIGLGDAREVWVSRARLDQLQAAGDPVHFSGTLAALDRAVEGRPADAPIEFIAIDDATEGSTYLVNTEGFAYARYLGRVVVIEEATR